MLLMYFAANETENLRCVWLNSLGSTKCLHCYIEWWWSSSKSQTKMGRKNLCVWLCDKGINKEYAEKKCESTREGKKRSSKQPKHPLRHHIHLKLNVQMPRREKGIPARRTLIQNIVKSNTVQNKRLAFHSITCRSCEEAAKTYS